MGREREEKKKRVDSAEHATNSTNQRVERKGERDTQPRIISPQAEGPS